MLTIRLQRVGRINDPSFRVVVVESKRGPQTGNYLEMLGSYDARADRTELNVERIKHWLSMGAQTSDTVHNLLISKKIIEGKKINVLPRKSPPKAEGAEASGAAATESSEARNVAAEQAVSSGGDSVAEAPAADAGAAGGDGASA
jgi:small subunit ribosomal protein S16